MRRDELDDWLLFIYLVLGIIVFVLILGASVFRFLHG